MRLHKILFLFLLGYTVFAQERSQTLPSDDQLKEYPYWIDMMQDPEANFFDTQYAFELYWKDRTARKGAGWKPFKRWENFMQDRISLKGEKPSAQEILSAIEYEMSVQQSSVENSGNWTELGPIQLPANGTGQPNGLGRVNCIAFHPVHGDTIFVGAPAGGLWKTTDGGGTWSSNTDDLATLGVSSIVINPTNPDTMYMGTGDRDGGDAVGLGVYKSTDAGASWQSSNSGMGNITVGALLIDPNDHDILIAGTSSGVYRSTDAGANWTLSAAGNYKDLRFMPGNSDIVYGSDSGEFYRSADNGVTWTLIGTSDGLPTSSRMVIGVTEADSSYVYALLTSGSVFQGMYRSVDSGLTFSLRSDTPNIMDYSTDGSGTGGQAWYDLCIAVSPVDKEDVYVGGVNIFKSTDGGSTWTINAHWVGSGGAPDVHADHHALEYSPINQRLYSGNDGGLYYQPLNTGTWTDISSGLAIAQCYKIGQSATSLNYVIVGYQDNGTAVYKNGLWSTEIGGDGMECAIDHTTTDYMYGELYYGAIRRSSNGGTSFNSIAGDGVNGITESGAWVTPFTLHTSNPNTMFVGYEDIWRSTNVKANSSGSVSWTEISSGLGGTSKFKVVEHNAVDTNIFYASKGSSIFRSDNVNDTTVSWQTLTAPTISTIYDILSHPEDTNTVYIAQGTKVYESIDKGVNWTDISGTLSGSTNKNCLAFSNVAGAKGLYVGSDYGVYFRKEGTSVWLSYSNGLPNYPKITELEIFINDALPSQNSLRACSYGRGLWTTSIYIDPNTPLGADFYSEDSLSCVGTTVDLIDATSGVPDSWLWEITPGTFSYTNGTDSASQFPKVSFSSAGNYSVQLIVSNSNESDTITKNDYIVISSGNDLDLELTTDTYASETSWELKNSAGVVVYSGSGYSNSTTNNINMSCLTDSCYTFTINDTYGDGICCSYGNGGYLVTNANGDTVASGGDFGFSEATSICFAAPVEVLDCSNAIDLSCGMDYSGTTVGGNSNVSGYSCSSLNEGGEEVVHAFTLSESADITIELNASSDLNAYLLSACYPDSCLAYGDSIISGINLGQGNYYIVVDGAAGTAGSYILSYDSEIVLTLNAIDSELCTGDTTTLIANGASTYSWSPTTGLSATTGSSVSAYPLTTTTYTVTGTTNGCSSTDTITIEVNDLPTVIASADNNAICNGDTTILTVSGADSYSWSPSIGLSSTTGTTVSAYPMVSTDYIVTGTTDGCASSDTITITVNNQPTLSIVTDNTSICNGDTAGLTVTGADSYNWSPATGLSSTTGNTVSAYPSVTSTYIVTGTTDGCSSTDTVIVVVNDLPVLSVLSESSIICSGDTSTLTASGADSYNWSPSTGLSSTVGAVVNAYPSVTTTYTITGASNGCSVTDTVVVTVNDVPSTVVTTNTSLICLDDTAFLTASGADSYSWSPSTGLSSTTGANVNAYPSETTTYTVTGTTNNCSSEDTITVYVNPVLDVAITADQSIICSGDTATLSGTGASNYTWMPSAGLSSTLGNTVLASPTVTTTYYLTGDTNGCSDLDSITLVVNSNPIVEINSLNTLICNGDTSVLTANGADSYSWSPAAGLSSTTGGNVNAFPSFTTTYTVTGITGGCSSTEEITIIVEDLPVVIASVDNDTICNGENAVLMASGADSYSWSPSVGLSNTTGAMVTANPVVTTTYTVTGTSDGCSMEDSITVYIDPIEYISVQFDNNPLCPGDSVLIVCTGSSAYTISPGQGVNMISADSAWLSPTVNTDYIVSGVAGGNCTVSDSISVQVLPLSQLEIYSNINTVYLLNPETVNFGANGDSIVDYSWTFGDGNESSQKGPSHDYTMEGIYTVVLEAINEDNCVLYDSLTIEVINNLGIAENTLDWMDIYPNPNTGLIQLHIKNDNYKVNSVKLFDTAGRVIFQHNGEVEALLVIDIQDKADGNYILEIRTDAEMFTKLLNKRSK